MNRDKYHSATVFRSACTLFLLQFTVSSACFAQVIEQEAIDVPGTITSIDMNSSDDKQGSDIVVVPLPVGSPTFGQGLAVTAAVLFETDEQSQSSFVGVGGVYTSNDTWGVGVAQSVSLAKDKFRTSGAIGYAEVNYDFFGVGYDAGESGNAVPLNQTVFGVTLGGQMRVMENLYAGPRMWYFDVAAGVNSDLLAERLPLIDEAEFDLREIGVGFLVSYDTVDNGFFPTSGSKAEFKFGYGRTDVGDRLNFSVDYQKLEVEMNHYWALDERSVLALRGSMCRTWGTAPLFDLCLFGANNDLRGYVAGQFRDNAKLAAQAEYRVELFGPLSGAVFGGIGAIADDFASINGDELLPAGGAGLRWRVSDEFRLDFAIDYAVGRDSDALYFRIGQAF
jgi:hypothetical protein